MTLLRYILASLWHYRRVHVAVAMGVAVATAVITGALLVGDSVRGSLRGLVLEGLGRIDQILVAEQPFRVALAEELECEEVAPLMLIPGTLTTPSSKNSRRATRLSIVGHTNQFWQLGQGTPPAPLEKNEIAVSRSIALELGVTVGDEVLLHVPLANNMPAESVLGEKSETTTAARLQIGAVLADQGLFRFSLRPSQLPPRNVFLPLATLQRLLELPARVNAVAIVGSRVSLQPTLADYNLTVTRDPDATYLGITAGRLVLPPALVAAFRNEFPNLEIQPAITYLANTIKLGDRQIPYSTITGVDSLSEIGPLLDDDGQVIQLSNDEIVLNDWAAKNLQAKVGDTITITYYEPETTHGVLREAKPQTLKLRAIVPLLDSQGHRTLAGDPRLTPALPGVTDQRSMSDWDLPFELVEPIRQVDEDYWDQYSTTPKAFVSYALAKNLWRTRWGTDSVLRIPASTELSVEEIQQRVRPDPSEMGMALLRARENGLAAARGTTAFEGLFLGFSFFLVVSAVMLIALLFRIGVESRASELGVLGAVGWNETALRRAWLREASFVALLGALVGVAAGIAYARLMIYGLSTWWVAAMVTPFLQLHVTPTSLAFGFGFGLLVALLTIVGSLRKLMRLPARQLLAGDCSEPTELTRVNKFYWLPAVLITVAAALGALAIQLQGEAQAGAFFGSGALVLGALLTWLRQRLRRPSFAPPRALTLTGLATRNARRHPSRTILSVGLAAVACFLIIALSAFRLVPTEQGTGGFTLIATADQPLHYDLDTSGGREQLGFSSRERQQLAESKTFGFRVRTGEDASCLNLFQAVQPEIVGVPTDFYDQRQFGWATLAESSDASPWKQLDADRGTDEAGRAIVPIILDKNTAIYSLHLSGLGARLSVKDALGQSVTLEVVGLLANSIFQGKVLVSEHHFLRLFPEASGQQLFLIRATPPEAITTDAITTLLETQLEDYGFDAVRTDRHLESLMAVQNTYLSTFQSLGALGLLLGTVGLAIAQLRSVLQRRGELALLRSLGFSRSRLARMVLGENAILLFGGLGMGALAALVAVLPHWWMQSAGTPWGTLLLLMGAVVVSGLIAGGLAVRAAVRVPLLAALRGD